MASFIPFDHSSFVLGHIVEPELLNLLEEMKKVQVETDVAMDKMNSFIALKRGFGMTMNELQGLQIDVSTLKTKLEEVDVELSASASEYLDIRIKNDSILQGLRVKMAAIRPPESPESPLDLSAARLVPQLLASDSIRMNIQYFGYGSDEATSNRAMADIQETIKEHTAEMPSESRAIAKNAIAQIELQRRSRSLAGTLIIMATCTHRNAAVLNPVVFDADKLVAAWNFFHGRSEHALDLATASPTRLRATLASALTRKDAADGPVLHLLTGMSTGSSFVGMVHTLNDDNVHSDIDDDALKDMQSKLRLGAWLQNSAGGFGVDSDILDSVRSKILAKNVSCSANVIVTGALVSLSPGNFEMGVDKFLEDDGRAPDFEDDDDSVESSVDYSAFQARRTRHRREIDNERHGSMLEHLHNADSQSQKVIDVNTLMSAFNGYVRNVREKSFVGVPLNFFTRKITKDDVVRIFCDNRGLLPKFGRKGSGPPPDAAAATQT
jgi:hypothetical protein